ncbi:MAG: hypothetical protein AAGA33_09245 [Pseudomonadota bacterium]
MILVVNHGQDQARSLKQLIEFMDTPEVLTATPEAWRDCLGDDPLEALFVGADLSESDVKQLLIDVGRINPDVPIVMMQGENST